MRIGYVDPDTSFNDTPFRDPLVRAEVDRIDQYELTLTEPTIHRALIVPGLVDQEHLFRERAWVRAFLDGGGVLNFCGHLFRSWLPGAVEFVPKPIASHADYVVRVVTPHPIFAGIDPLELTYRRGVAGFFARGHHPPPIGAEVLLALPGGEPTTYVDRATTRGTILVHGGNDLISYAAAEGALARLAPQLLSWLRAEASRHARERVA